MLRYTARNGTTFHFDPCAGSSVRVFSPDAEESDATPVDLDDLREFVGYVDDVLEAQDADFQTDADATAVGPD
jgi:hypothetical protein